MNKLLLLFMLLLPTCLYSQVVVPQIIEQTGGLDNGTINFSISGKMLKMAIESDNSDLKKDKALQAFLSNVKKMSVLVNLDLDGEKKAKIRNILKPYGELMSVNENNAKIGMYTREEKGQTVEFVMCVEQDNNLTVLNIAGIIDLVQLAKISDGIEVNGTSYLKKLGNLKNKKTTNTKSK